MITFDKENNRFNYRVVGIAIFEDKVLLHKADIDNFWSLPGGRVEMQEPSDVSLKREMREELEIEIEIDRLLWWVENFFDYAGKNYHELALYYLMKLPAGAWLHRQSEPFQGIEEGTNLTFRWFGLKELDSLAIYPSFLKQTLKALPPVLQHIIHYDDKKTEEMYLQP